MDFLPFDFRVLNCGLKLQTDGFGLDTEIGILSYLAFVQDVQLKVVLKEMVKVCLYIAFKLCFCLQMISLFKYNLIESKEYVVWRAWD